MKIGRISYLNVVPFYEALEAERGPFVQGSPAYLAKVARDGHLDAAPLPLAETFYIEDEFEPVSNFGVACKGPVGSVLLFSRRPFDELTGARLLFTPDSITSAALARYLLDRAGNQDYSVERGDQVKGYDGYMAIGDRALQAAQDPPFAHVTDLSERWFDLTHLPFVFARWMIRKSVPLPAKKKLAESLAQSLTLPPTITEANSAGLSPRAAREYLSHIIYRLDAECLKSVELFRREMRVLT